MSERKLSVVTLLVCLLFLETCKCLCGQTPPLTNEDLSDIPAELRAYFRVRSPIGTAADPRISSRFKINGVPIPSIRSIALIIAISEYPNFEKLEDQHLDAAAKDRANLEAFLNRQGFDEIIVLENKAATPVTINSFLRGYLQNQLNLYPDGARILIAYSGHGAPGTPDTEPGSLVLGNAKGAHDTPNIYPLDSLEVDFKALGKRCFQFLALINACNSGGLFSTPAGAGDNNMFPGAQGAHAVTATQPDQLAYALTPGSGSIFFDTLIKGVDSGEADPMYAGSISLPNGKSELAGGGIVRLGMLTGYLSYALDHTVNPETHTPFPQPEWGSIRTGKPSKGAFFFLVPQQQLLTSLGAKKELFLADAMFSSSLMEWASEKSVPALQPDEEMVLRAAASTLSAYKRFNAPDTYPVLGIDISSFNGEVNWLKVASTPKMKFAYLRATSGSKKDSQFERNWRDARGAKLRCGAYHVPDFARSATEQFELIKEIVPKEPDALPLVLDVELYSGRNKAGVAKTLLELKDLCTTHYGKPPVFYGNSAFFADFKDLLGSGNTLWLARYQIGQRVSAPSLAGTDPWTLWQFTDNAIVDGVSGGADMNAFFGSEEDFNAFARGEAQVALKAALGTK